jgi:hypothetical protein
MPSDEKKFATARTRELSSGSLDERETKAVTD